MLRRGEGGDYQKGGLQACRGSFGGLLALCAPSPPPRRSTPTQFCNSFSSQPGGQNPVELDQPEDEMLAQVVVTPVKCQQNARLTLLLVTIGNGTVAALEFVGFSLHS